MALREIAAYFGFDIDTAKLDAADHKIEGLIHSIKNVAVVAGALEVVHWTSELVEGVAHAGDELITTAQKIGVTAHELQALQFAARAVNIEAGTLTQGLGFLQRNAFAAANGSKEMAANFAKLGVNVRGPNGELKGVNELMLEVADGLNNTSNESEKTALSMAILGRAGKEFKPLFARGAEGVKELTDRFEELGGGISDETLKKSRELDEAQKEQTASMNSLKAKIADGLMPAKIALTKALVRLLQWFNNSPRLIKLVTDAIQVLTKALIVFAAIKTAQVLAPFLAKNILPMIANLANFGRELFAVVGMQGGLRALAAAAWAMMKPFATVTFVLLGFLFLDAIVEDFVGFLQGKKSVVGDFFNSLLMIDGVREAWEKFYKVAKQTMDFVIAPFAAAKALITGKDTESAWLTAAREKIEEQRLHGRQFVAASGNRIRVRGGIATQDQSAAIAAANRNAINMARPVAPVNIASGHSMIPGSTYNQNSGGILINVNGAKDPRATAVEVKKHLDQAARQAHANFDSTPEGSGI